MQLALEDGCFLQTTEIFMRPDRAFFDRLADAAKAETLAALSLRPRRRQQGQAGFDPGDRRRPGRRDRDPPADRGSLSRITAFSAKSMATIVRARQRPVWVIDPIDGTRAFISGVPVWGTLIGFRSMASR